MLFDLRPKDNLKELYDRREEYAELSRLVEAGSWVVVLGKRMTGKTSLIKTYSSGNKGVYVNLLGTKGIQAFTSKLMGESGFTLRELELNLKLFGVKWTRVAENIFSRLKNKLIVLDEVQEVCSPHFLKLLKSVWDSQRGISFVFSGSLVGLVKALVEPGSTSPLYGRSPAKLVLKPFSRDTSQDFLEAGFQENGFTITQNELQEVVDLLDGYVGWLTYYGHSRCVRRMDHKSALEHTLKEGTKIALSELKQFLKGRQRQLYVRSLRVMSVGARWSDVKRATGANSKVVTQIISTLKNAMIVDEHQGLYTIDDPIFRRAATML